MRTCFKKGLAAMVVVFILIMLLPVNLTLAATLPQIADGQTLNIATGVLTWTADGAPVLSAEGGPPVVYTINDGDTISVAAGAAATVTGGKNVMISCDEGAALTLSDVTVDVSTVSGACALCFTGNGNTLTLVGANTLKSGSDRPGVQVQSGTVLEIAGLGSLNVAGGMCGAGIGGGHNGSGGTITVAGTAQVTATGGMYGAGIGGGWAGSGGTITVTDTAQVTATSGGSGAGIGGGVGGNGGIITVNGTAKVTTTGGDFGAGIGGGDYSDGGTITVAGAAQVAATGGDLAAGIGGGEGIGMEGGSGGTITVTDNAQVTATGGRSGAGIGGGTSGSGGTITLADAVKVTATGGEYAAGVGGGANNKVGTVTIKGGVLYAKKGDGGGYDIGSGQNGATIATSISGNAAVLLGTDKIANSDVELSTTTHTHYSFTAAAENIYGVPVPAEWGPPFGAYLRLATLRYNANGGVGAEPVTVEQQVGTQAALASGNGITKDKNTNGGWNTAADGSVTNYTAGDMVTLTEDMTLFVKWDAVRVSGVSLSDSTATLKKEATLPLAATVSPANAANAGVTWQSSNAAVATVTASGLVTAVGSGTAIITATTADGGYTASCTVTVLAAGGSAGGGMTATPTPQAAVQKNGQALPAATATQAPTSTPAPAPSSSTGKIDSLQITPSSVKVDGAAGTVTILLNPADLPAGATALKLPDGTVVEVGEGDSVSLTINESDLAADGTFLLTVLDENGMPLASGTVQAIPIAGADSNLSATFWWVAGGTSVLAIAAAAAYLLLRKKPGEQE